jgi:hypothetical protein
MVAPFGYPLGMKRSAWFAIGVAVAIGACGDDKGAGELIDAPLPPDGSVSELPPPRVAVSVTLGGMPAMGQIVYFQRRDSTLASESQTNSGGNAAGVVDDGGFVTVIEPAPLAALPSVTTRLATFSGVKPLDELHVDVTPLPSPGTPITFTVTVPDEQVGHTYTLASSCGTQGLGRGNVGATTLSAPVTLTGCNGMADLLVLATDAGGQLTGWQYRPDAAVGDGMAVAFTGAYLPPVGTTFTYTNLPASSGLSVERELRSARGSLYRTGPVAAPLAGTMATVTTALPAPAGVQAVTTTIDQPTTGNARQTIVEVGAAGASYLIDYPGVALRGYATQPALDPASHAITWTEGAGHAPDFVLATYRTDRNDAVPHTWFWRIAAPYVAGQTGTAKVLYPALPATLYDFGAKPGDVTAIERLVAVTVPGGYDAARGLALDSDLPVPVDGMTGRIVYQELVVPPAPARAIAPIGRTLPRGRFTLPAR